MNANLSVNFKNRSRIDLAIVNTYIYLENTFDPTGINDDSPITEGAYDTSQFEFDIPQQIEQNLDLTLKLVLEDISVVKSFQLVIISILG